MLIRAKLFHGTLAATLLGGVLLACSPEALGMSQTRDIVVVKPASLPELARRHGIAFQLYTASGTGADYLYIEQHQGERMLVLDVSDPSRIRQVAATPLTVPAPFDFVRPLGASAYLVRFRNSRGIGILDLRRPKAPTLRVLSSIEAAKHTETLSESAILLVDEPPRTQPANPRDYQVVAPSSTANPATLLTVRQVDAETSRQETGTTFLLGADGLTVIRRPSVEQAWKTSQSYTN